MKPLLIFVAMVALVWAHESMTRQQISAFVETHTASIVLTACAAFWGWMLYVRYLERRKP